jgi:hypothetical protein
VEKTVPTRIALALALFTFSCAALAQTSVKGSFGNIFSDGGSFFATFSCLGAPACSGIYNGSNKIVECPNLYINTDAITITGLDLTHSGPISGAIQLTGIDVQAHQGSNTSVPCNFTVDTTTISLPFTGAWDAATGTGTLTATGTDDTNQPFTLPGTFSAIVAAAPPVFPMTVTGSITPASTNVSAAVQPRTQDVGTNKSLFVFAHAPSNLVSGAGAAKRVAPQPPIVVVPEDAAIVCVLAQVNASGQLVAVSAANMQAYLTGVLTSQSQAVTILNNVATPNVAGATVYVGYGTSAASMLSSAVYQTAISVPGAVQCTASLASAPAPESPGALTGLWWNPNESGWGIDFTQRGNNIFAAWFTYDASGNPKWYVAPSCAGAAASSGTCNGILYEVNGPTFFGTAFNTNLVNVVTAGSLQVNFQNASNGSMSYIVGTQSRTVLITRQSLGSGTTPPAIDYSDLWWNPNESGWGMAITQQFGNMFLAWYVYDSTGKPLWYVASNCVVTGSSCSGALYRTTGPPFGPPLDPLKVNAFQVGSAIVSFVDANNAVLSYTVNGVSATKTITRQIF